jgi:GNAT superfamily N-acetyltransferase
MTNTATVATALRRDSIALRPRAETDAAFLRHLYGATRESEMRLVAWTDEEKCWFLDMQFAAQRTHYEEHYPDGEFLVIELDGRPIGRLSVDRGDEDIRIADVALLPEFRGRGIGRLLMEEILAECSCTGKAVTIHVERDNPARRLYHRLGFRHVDTTGVYHLLKWRA